MYSRNKHITNKHTRKMHIRKENEEYSSGQKPDGKDSISISI